MKIILSLLLIFFVLLAGCAQQVPGTIETPPELPTVTEPVIEEEKPKPIPEPEPLPGKEEADVETETSEEETTDRTAEDGVREIRLIAKRWLWEPQSVSLVKGEKVRFVLSALDDGKSYGYNFYLPEFKDVNNKSIDLVVTPESSASVEFVPKFVQNYKATCQVRYCGEKPMIVHVEVKPS